MNNKEHLKEGLDLKRFGLYLQKRIWIVIMLAALGAGLGVLSYQVIRSVYMPIEYEAVSKLYLQFNVDESGKVYQEYNGYTWNDLIDSDPIMDAVMANLPGYDKDEVREATTADIISDIRLLTIYVSGDNEKFVREVQSAMEAGLSYFGLTSGEIQYITPIRSIAPERVYWDDRTAQSAILGAVILGVVSLLGYLFGYVLNETICVQSDLEKRFPIRALGIMTRSQKGLQPYNQELKANLLYLLSEHKTLIFIDIDDHAALRAQDLERILNWNEGGELLNGDEVGGNLVWHIKDTDDDDWFGDEGEKEWKIFPFNSSSLTAKECEFIRNNQGVILLVPFGVNNASRKTERVLSLLKNQDCNVYGAVISEADEGYLNRYFA